MSLGVSASGGEPHLSDVLKQALEIRRRHRAQGSIRVQEGQPQKLPILINTLLAHARPGFEPGPGRDVRKHEPKSRSRRARGYPISHTQPDVPAKIDFVELVGEPGSART